MANVKKTDEELVALSQGGDGLATEEILIRYAGLVRSLARGFFMVGGETEDLIQEGMFGLYGAIVNYRKESQNSFKAFARLCVSRRIMDAVRSAASKKNAPLNGYVALTDWLWHGEPFSVEDQLILSDEKREFKQKMSKALSDFEFKLMMMYMEGMSCAEICEATGKTAKSVDNAVQRSKKKLQKIIGKE